MALVLSACSRGDGTTAQIQAEPTGSANNLATLGMPLPRSLADSYARALTDDIPGLYALGTFNGSDPLCFEPNPNDPSSFDAPQETTIQVTQGETLSIDIRWYETLDNKVACDGEGLLLAIYSDTTSPINTDSTLDLDIQGYQLDGDARLDADADGVSNLAERQAGTDPFIDDSDDALPDVRISFVEPDNAPVIDGLYDPIYTDRAQFRDDQGNLLAIDNLMVDEGAIRSDGDTEFRWFAMHDNTWLYIFVLGETVALANPIRDSTEVFQDDSLDIFIDADNSKGSSYDGINDRHILIPLISEAGNTSGSNTTVFEPGPNSASIPSFDFATCVCDDQHTWEMRIPLADFSIQSDNPFGLEVQLNLDNDGGARDAKWGWEHPSRVNTNTDNTFFNPSFMGTAVLN